MKKIANVAVIIGLVGIVLSFREAAWSISNGTPWQVAIVAPAIGLVAYLSIVVLGLYFRKQAALRLCPACGR